MLDAKRPIFSQVRAKQQGHTCILDGDTPGLIIKGTNLHIPFVECPESGFCLLPAYPPPSSCAIHNTIYSSSMNVINLNQSTSIHNTVAHYTTKSKSIHKSKKVAGKKINIAAKLRAQRNLTNKRADLTHVHKRCGHVDMKRLCRFKREGKLIATRLPPKFLRSFRDSCPLCLAMKRRRNPRPKSSMLGQNELAHWQEVYCDSSGKFRTVSKAKNRYFTLFVCAKSGGKVFIAHRKKKHFPAVYLKFIQRIGRHPQLDASQFV